MPRPAVVNPEDKLFTIAQCCDFLQLERHSVAKMFRDEPGVFVLGVPETNNRKRRYKMLRIPQSVINRVLSRRVQ